MVEIVKQFLKLIDIMLQEKTVKKMSFLQQLRDFGAGPIIGMGISMLTVPITTRLLAPEEFGKSSLFSLIQTIFNLVALCGMDQAFVRFYNDYKNEKKKLLCNAMALPLSVCTFVVVIGFLFKNKISFFMFGSYEPLIIVLFLLSLPVIVIMRYALLTIRMNLNGKLYSGLNILNQVINFGVLLLFLFYYERTFRSIVLSSIISTHISCFFSLAASKILFIPKKNYFDKKLISKLLYYGMPLIPSSILAWILNSFDKVSLRMWSSFSELGLYAAAFKIVSIMNIFQTIFATAWTPIAYKWHDEKRDNKYFEYAGLLTVTCFSLVFIAVVLFRDIIFLFLGEAYRNSSEIFVFLCFTPFLYSISEVTSMGIYFAKKTNYILLISLIAVLINIVGDYFMVGRYGARGVAFITFLSYTIWFWLRTIISRKFWFDFNLIPYFISILLLVVISFCVFIKAAFLVELLIAVLSVFLDLYILWKSFKGIKLLQNVNSL